MNIVTKVKKWGNSASVRIPSEVLAVSRLKLDDPITISVDHNRIIIEAVRKKYQLDELLKQMNDENLHQEIDFGGAVGNEEW